RALVAAVRVIERASDRGRLLLGRGLLRLALCSGEGAQLWQTFEREECKDNRRVELDAGPEAEVLARLRFGAGRSPGARVGERGVGICDAEDARAQRYLLAAQSVRVAAAAEP